VPTDFILVSPGALDGVLCAEIVRRFEASPDVSRGITGGGLDPARKDSLDLTISERPEWAPIVERVLATTFEHLKRYARAHPLLATGALSVSLEDPTTGEPRAVDHHQLAALDDDRLGELLLAIFRFGPLNVQRYARGTGGYHHWHSEIYPRGEALHRVLFFQYYLDDVADGGETEFFFQERRIAPRRGTLLMAPAGFTHAHKGHVPLSSDKTIVTSWVLYRRAEELSRG
jgi:hypothetical protein